MTKLAFKLAAITGLMIMSVAGHVAHAAYPDKAVQLVVGSSPGGASDTLARIVADKLSEMWKQPVVIANKPGADNSIAAEFVARSAPDGYTLAWLTNAHSITPSQIKLNYDPIKSFELITLTIEAPSVLLVRPSFPANSVKELVALAKAQPGKLNFGSPPGKASPAYLEAALLMKLGDIKMVDVFYKGGAEAVLGLLRGDVDMYFATISTSLPHVRGGTLKPLAITTKTRSPLLPDLPTVAEAMGWPEYEGSDWFGVLAPAGTPKDVVEKLNKDIVAVLKSPDVTKRITEIGATVRGTSREEFSAILKSDMAKWAALLKELGVKVE